MSPADIASRVADIGRDHSSGGAYGEPIIWDDEAAHTDEDKLHRDVFRAIADGKCEDPAACARAALESLDLDFERACA